MEKLIEFILDQMPPGVIVFARDMRILHLNRTAEKFFKRHKPPEEITSLTKRIFEAMDRGKVHELFPGEIYVHSEIEGSPSKWSFKFCLCDDPGMPFVAVFIIEHSVSMKINLNEFRRSMSLTRREVDVLRRVLDGLRNTDIAEDLSISEQTVKDHLSNVYMKTGMKNRLELVRALIGAAEE